MGIYEDMCAVVADFKPIPRRALHCHPWVMSELLRSSAPIPEPDFLSPLGKVDSLTGFDVFEKPDMPFGAWELHEGDNVIDSGVLRFTVISAEYEVDERLTND